MRLSYLPETIREQRGNHSCQTIRSIPGRDPYRLFCSTVPFSGHDGEKREASSLEYTKQSPDRQ
jgi:hypothetical protein